jgi:glycosyltransferase involved in cell wall biosynthesis
VLAVVAYPAGTLNIGPMAGRATVSVIIPARNAASTIGGTLASLASDREIFSEVIVVDDLSFDGTAVVAADAAATLGLPLRLLPASAGDAGAARNLGIAASTGDWLYFLDADDLYLAGAMDELLRAGERNPRCGLVAGGYRRKVDGRRRGRKRPTRLLGQPGVEAERYLTGAIRSFPVGSVLVSRRAVGEHRFPEGLPYDEDTIFWTTMLGEAPAVTIAREVMIYHVSTERADERYAKLPKRAYLRWRRAIRGLAVRGLAAPALRRRAGIVALKIARVHYARSEYGTAARFLALARVAPKSPRDAWRYLRYRLKVALALRLTAMLPDRARRQASAR